MTLMIDVRVPVCGITKSTSVENFGLLMLNGVIRILNRQNFSCICCALMFILLIFPNLLFRSELASEEHGHHFLIRCRIAYVVASHVKPCFTVRDLDIIDVLRAVDSLLKFERGEYSVTMLFGEIDVRFFAPLQILREDGVGPILPLSFHFPSSSTKRSANVRQTLPAFSLTFGLVSLAYIFFTMTQ